MLVWDGMGSESSVKPLLVYDNSISSVLGNSQPPAVHDEQYVIGMSKQARTSPAGDVGVNGKLDQTDNETKKSAVSSSKGMMIITTMAF